jgi:SAM-dependent methyltransferase
MQGIKGRFATSYDKFISRDSLLPAGLPELVKSFETLSILEFGCGTGSVALGLSLAGYEVAGVDFSADMLGSARQKAHELNAKVKFIKADIIDVDLRRQYDLLLCLGNTVPLIYGLGNARRLFRNFARHLRPAGTLIIQQLNYDRILKERPGTLAVDRAENNIRIKQYKYGKILIDFAVTLIDHSKIPPVMEISHSKIRPWTKSELAAELRKAGFYEISAFGDYKMNRFSLKSKDLVMVGKTGRRGDQ